MDKPINDSLEKSTKVIDSTDNKAPEKDTGPNELKSQEFDLNGEKILMDLLVEYYLIDPVKHHNERLPGALPHMAILFVLSKKRKLLKPGEMSSLASKEANRINQQRHTIYDIKITVKNIRKAPSDGKKTTV